MKRHAEMQASRRKPRGDGDGNKVLEERTGSETSRGQIV